MEIGLKAFFYKSEYYLMPDGYSEDALFGEIHTKKLVEKNCKAPNFVREEMQDVVVDVDGELPVFAVSVNLYDRFEYDCMLKENVKKRCPGCFRFGGDSEDLTGHYEEMSVDGYCCLRTPEDDISFGWMMRACTYRLAELSDELKKCIEDNDQKTFQEKVSLMMGTFFLPVESYGGYTENGKLLLAFVGNVYLSRGFQIILRTFADLCNATDSPLKEKGWVVYPFAPRDLFHPTLPDGLDTESMEVFVNDGDELTLTVKVDGVSAWKDDEVREMNDGIYKYMCYRVGEDLLLAGSHAIKITDEVGDYGKKVSMDELHATLYKHATREFDSVPFPAPYALEPSVERGKDLPYKDHLESWVTVCPEFSPDGFGIDFDHDDEDETDDVEEVSGFNAGKIYETFGIRYVYIYFPSEPDLEYDKKEVFYDELYSLIDLHEELKGDDIGVFCTVGTVTTKHGTVEDYMVFDDKKFFELLCRLAPVLQKMQAKIVVVDEENTSVYEPDYELRPSGVELFS